MKIGQNKLKKYSKTGVVILMNSKLQKYVFQTK